MLEAGIFSVGLPVGSHGGWVNILENCGSMLQNISKHVLFFFPLCFP